MSKSVLLAQYSLSYAAENDLEWQVQLLARQATIINPPEAERHHGCRSLKFKKTLTAAGSTS